jgi:hypothetical protein
LQVKQYLPSAIGILTIVLTLSGCTTFNGLKPLHPAKTGFDLSGVLVEERNPTFKWEPYQDAHVSYSFRLYEEKVSEESVLGLHARYKALTYERTDLKSNQHQLETDLTPNTRYFWSVKPNIEGSEWSTYDYYYFAVISWGFGFDLPHSFSTPLDME